MQVLYDAGYEAIESDTRVRRPTPSAASPARSTTCSATTAAMDMVTGADIWDDQRQRVGGLPVQPLQLQRHPVLRRHGPFAASDHNPEIVGIDLPTGRRTGRRPDPRHERLPRPAAPTTPTPRPERPCWPVRSSSCATQNPNTVFAAAGDLIGASTFESFIQDDKPTIDALNEAGLEVSAVGQPRVRPGVRRPRQPGDGGVRRDTNPRGGAEWEYIAANVQFKDDGSDALDGDLDQGHRRRPGRLRRRGDRGPAGAGLARPASRRSRSPTSSTATNDAADDLKAEGADVVVLLVHEGRRTTDCASIDDDPTSDFGSIVTGVNDNVDAIVSGHTHLAYNCSSRSRSGRRPGGDQASGGLRRPVRHQPQPAGVHRRPATGTCTAKTQAHLPGAARDDRPRRRTPTTRPTRRRSDRRRRGRRGRGLGPSRWARSPARSTGPSSPTAPRRTAAASRPWATWWPRSSGGRRRPETGRREIAFMNPGGLRADMVGDGSGATRATLTYRQAANVQPFANTLVNMELTGAQIRTVAGAAVAATAGRPVAPVPAARRVGGLHLHLRRAARRLPGRDAG